MHELSICRNMLSQIEALADEHHAVSVQHVKVQLGPLAGIEAHLLQQAFPIAMAGSIAAKATLEIESLPVRVQCRQCGTQSDASINNLTCPACGHWQTRLLSGDEMLLASLEMDVA